MLNLLITLPVYFFLVLPLCFFRVFFEVMQFRMRYYTRGRHGVTDMAGKRYLTRTAVSTVNFPSASVSSGQEVLVPAFSLRQMRCGAVGASPPSATNRRSAAV